VLRFTPFASISARNAGSASIASPCPRLPIRIKVRTTLGSNAHDTESARALQRGAQQERETKERLRRQAAENAARRAAAAEAEVRDATPAKQPS
jgi:GTP cyclohydrolase III